MVLVDKRFDLLFQPELVVDLIPQPACTYTVDDDQLRLMMRYGKVKPFLKFPELDIQDFRVAHGFPVVTQFFNMQVHNRPRRRQVFTRFARIIDLDAFCCQ